MSIHPLVWILVGTLVTGISWFVGDSLIIFFYVGVAFFAWGLFWILIRRITAPEKAPREGVQRRAKRFVCYRCKQEVGPVTQYCPHCGVRIR
ncbi:hypothetical protein GF342_03630 [Candidatus Woesearchaeota archaeon]|nr:hypothetical protein [Candidatus Woesearchaeota archaeon]